MGLLHRAAGRPMPANIGEPELLDSQAGHVTGLTSTQCHHTRPKPPDPGVSYAQWCTAASLASSFQRAASRPVHCTGYRLHGRAIRPR